MSLIDIAGLFVLSYATVACVWTLCVDLRPLPIEPERERPSALPLERF